MARCLNWNAVLLKFSSRLSSWKARLLSVGGRLTLIRSVLSNLPIYYMSLYPVPVAIRKKLEAMRNKFFIGGDPDEKKLTWIKWDKSLASKREGGLGIGSIFGLRGINCDTITRPKRSTWGSILSSINSLKSKGIDLFSFCSRKIGNGLDSSFWFDTWCGNQPLKTMYPRVFLLDTDKRCSIASRVGLNDWSLVLRRDPRGGVELVQFNALQNVIRNTILSDQRDIWQWSLDGSSGFSVASIRSLVDSRLLVTCNEATRWNRLLPIKVNVFLWRLKLNKLPSRVTNMVATSSNFMFCTNWEVA
ncbi:RNA-directed DNA polymerase, eukaryota, Reverse transcriptase zinc-binding domain protein [Artemisia annua]|uniref:RNA-directed DNA polymerase, eukaryota, Reverse transcriptase zinc-binding domain protein n=1 Tax=Artemisia annua TaxID=35608 RepID=A0A2U1NEW8_ARTAN|nr:RNA-directed DNA polymerase, eukaryota, Reverse transcriptase zinc-binding domain protein [Artemisia annua]